MHPAPDPPTRVRYRVLGMAVVLAFITYLDRVCISITAPRIMHDLALTTRQMSYVFSAFTCTYALFEIPTGWWGDRVGTRRVLTRIVLWWSAFTGLTATAWNLPSLLALRALFGIGEAGAWPNVAKTFSSWFPLRERGTAQGIFFMGAHLGGGLTPLLVALLLNHFHWRQVFVIFACTGVVWAAAWSYWFRDTPRQHSQVNAAEADYIEQGRARQIKGAPLPSVAPAALRSPSVWCLCLMYFTQTYGFYFFITWFPTYLQKEKGLTGLMLSLMSGAPLLFSVAGDLLGGLLTDNLTRRYNLRIGRSLVGGVSLFCACLFLTGGALTPTGWIAGILLGFAGMFSNFLLGASWGACLDLAGPRAGTVGAYMNTAGQVGGILSPIVYSMLTGNSPLFVIAGLYFIGALAWYFIHPERTLVPTS